MKENISPTEYIAYLKRYNKEFLVKENISLTQYIAYLKQYNKEHIIGYLAEMIPSMRIQRYKENISPNTIDINAIVSDQDLQQYTVVLTIDILPENIIHKCNCSAHAFSLCAHVATILYKVLYNLEQEVSGNSYTIMPTKQWRETFSQIIEQDAVLETGIFYIIPSIQIEKERVALSFFKVRRNKLALSSMKTEITVQEILDNVENYYHYSSSMPFLLEQITKIKQNFGHRIFVPTPLLSYTFWALSKEPYVFWGNTDILYTIDTQYVDIKLHTILTKNNVIQFSLVIEKQHTIPTMLEKKNTTILGIFPLWINIDNYLAPVRTSIPYSILENILLYNTEITQDEVPDFLELVWGKLPDTALSNKSTFLDAVEHLFQESIYSPKLFLDEEGSLLTITIENLYDTQEGTFLIEGPNPDLETGFYLYNNIRYFIRRDQKEEKEIIEILQNIGFHERTPAKWFLDSDKVINFLLNSYPNLIKKYAIFGEKKLHKYKISSITPIVFAEINTKNTSFLLDIKIEYNGEQVPFEDIWKQWITGKRYIQLKDGSFSSLPETWLRNAINSLELAGLPTASFQNEFPHYELGLIDKLLDKTTNIKADDFWYNLQNKLDDFKEIEMIDPPKGLHATLRSYQQFGLSYLNFLSTYGFSGILADEMGLGKTIQTLAFIQHQIETGNTKPNLVVVPTSVLYNWEREANKFIPEAKCLVIYGTGRENLFDKIKDSNIIFTTYVLLRRDLEILKQTSFNVVVLDEAQHIKNPNAITTRAVREINARMRLCLSGTPIENNLFELWSLFEFLMPNFLGSRILFQKNIIKPIRDGNNEVLEFFKKKINPFILRRMKKDVVKDLPEKIETTTFCSLEDEQKNLYHALAQQLKKQVLHDVDKKGIGKSQISILDALLKLRQICCHPKLLRLNIPGFQTQNIQSSKFETFKELIREITTSGHRVLVFSQFIQMLHIMRDWLNIENIPYCYLDGTTKNRISQIDVFNNSPDIPVFLISLKAGGIGLNLTTADYVIHYDPWWNPAVENQATDRAHRIGQTKQVFTYKLICQNTVEEKILLLQEQKKGIADSIIPAAALWKNITREDLEILFDI